MQLAQNLCIQFMTITGLVMTLSQTGHLHISINASNTWREIPSFESSCSLFLIFILGFQTFWYRL